MQSMPADATVPRKLLRTALTISRAAHSLPVTVGSSHGAFAVGATLLGVVALLSCGVFPEKVSLSDPRLAPMLRAIEAVDRSALGFTPIRSDARIRLEARGRAGYDAMLHVDGTTSRTIAFRKTATGYRWIHEQEMHYGPKTFATVDGPIREHITITFEVEHISGAPLGRTWVSYTGEDPRVAGRFDLTLKDVQPILLEWQANR
jgi:hypothetical protein